MRYIEQPTPEQTVQEIANAYLCVAFNESSSVASSQRPVYRSMQRALIAAIRQVYGLSALKANRVYDVLIDCTESIDYCVRYVKEHKSSNAYSR